MPKLMQEKMANKKSYHYSVVSTANDALSGPQGIAPCDLEAEYPRKSGHERNLAREDENYFTDRLRTRRDIDKICAEWIQRAGCALDARCAIVKGALATTRLSQSEEDEAIARANAGDNEAQRLLSLSFSIPALRPVLLRGDFEEDAADVFQNVMLKIIEAISGDTIKNAKDARETITPLIHQELARMTRERNRRAVEGPLQDKMPAEDGSGAPDEALNRRQELACVTSAMTSLSPRDRMTIMARMDGCTYREIGERLKISGERARQVEFRAIKALKAIIARGAIN